MINLLRGIGESIMVGNIKITVKHVNIYSKRVNIEIDAPREMSVYRAEVYDDLKKGFEIPLFETPLEEVVKENENDTSS